MSNGNLAPAQLRVLPGFLPYAAAQNFKPVTTTDHANQILGLIYTDAANMAADFESAMHQPLTYAEAYRTIDTQKQRKLENGRGGPSAAAVGYSNHGWGLAVDYRNGIGGGPGNSTYEWMHNNAGKYGFVEDVRGEHWHWHHPDSFSHTKPRATSTASSGKPPVAIVAPPADSVMEGNLTDMFAVELNGASTAPHANTLPKGAKFILDTREKTITRVDNNGSATKAQLQTLQDEYGTYAAVQPNKKALSWGGNTAWRYVDGGYTRKGW